MAIAPDKKPGSGTRYDRENPSPAEQVEKPESGMLERLMRVYEDLKLGTSELRAQVAEAEAQSLPEIPTRPEDVTPENAYRLNGDDLSRQIENETGAYDVLKFKTEEAWREAAADRAIDIMQTWKDAVERSMQLPSLKRNEFSSDYEYRRAVVEQGLARDHEPNTKGRITLFPVEQLLAKLVPSDMSAKQYAAVSASVMAQVEYAMKVCAAQLVEIPKAESYGRLMLRGEEEIMIDTIARSKFPMAEEYPASTASELSAFRALDTHILQLQVHIGEVMPSPERPTPDQIFREVARLVKEAEDATSENRLEWFNNHFGGEDIRKTYPGYTMVDLNALSNLVKKQLE